MPRGGRAKSSESKTSSGKKQPIEYGSQKGAAPAPIVQPLTPRPKLLALLAIVFALWMALLVVLYFTTIRSRRAGPPDTSVSGVAQSISRAVAPSSGSAVAGDGVSGRAVSIRGAPR